MSKVSFLISFSIQLALVGIFFFLISHSKIIFFPVNNGRKSCNIQKKKNRCYSFFVLPNTTVISLKKKNPKNSAEFLLYIWPGDVLGEDNHTFFVQGLFFVWWSIKVLMIFPMSLNFKI